MTKTWKAEAAPIKVWIVCIGSHRGNESVIGATYWYEHEAAKEARRLNDAHSQSRAYYVCRSLDNKPPREVTAGWGHE